MYRYLEPIFRGSSFCSYLYMAIEAYLAGRSAILIMCKIVMVRAIMRGREYQPSPTE